MNSDITDQYLKITYENFSRENNKLVNELKSASENKKINIIQKELRLIEKICKNLLDLDIMKKKNNNNNINNF